MSETFDFDRHFAVDGLFFSPGSQNIEIVGSLIYNAHGLSLERSAYVEETVKALSSQTEMFNILHGVTVEGNCTLFDLFEQQGPRTFLEDGHVLATGKYRIGSCVMRLHLSGKMDTVVTSATFRYAGLEHWLGSGVTQKVDWGIHEFAVSHPTTVEPLAERAIAAISARITLSYSYRSTHNHSESTVAGRPIITVKPDNPQSLCWFVDVSRRLENFFSLMLGVSTGITSMLVTVGDQNGHFLERGLAVAQTPQPERWVQCSWSHLADSLERWFSLPDSLRPIENLIYGTIRNSSLFVETEFLSLAQALESWHRLTDHSVIMPEHEFREVKRTFSGLIAFFFKSEEDIAQRLQESISHANEVTFRARIESLLGRITAEKVKDLLGDSAAFISKVKDTRNVFTHPGIRNTSATVIEPLALYRLNQTLHAFLRFLVLLYVGIPEDIAFGAVSKQIPR